MTPPTTPRERCRVLLSIAHSRTVPIVVDGETRLIGLRTAATTSTSPASSNNHLTPFRRRRRRVARASPTSVRQQHRRSALLLLSIQLLNAISLLSAAASTVGWAAAFAANEAADVETVHPKTPASTTSRFHSPEDSGFDRVHSPTLPMPPSSVFDDVGKRRTVSPYSVFDVAEKGSSTPLVPPPPSLNGNVDSQWSPSPLKNLADSVADKRTLIGTMTPHLTSVDGTHDDSATVTSSPSSSSPFAHQSTPTVPPASTSSHLHHATSFADYLDRLRRRCARQTPLIAVGILASSSDAVLLADSVVDGEDDSTRMQPPVYALVTRGNDEDGGSKTDWVVGELCRRSPYDRALFSRKVMLLNDTNSSQAGFGTLTLHRLFLMERIHWRRDTGGLRRGTADHLGASEGGGGGHDCVLAEADSDACRRCWHRTARLATEVAIGADYFDRSVVDHFDCEGETHDDRSDHSIRRFSPNATCDTCRTWYRRWLLVTRGRGVGEAVCTPAPSGDCVPPLAEDYGRPVRLWTWRPCAVWCEYAQLACPHVTIMDRKDNAGLPSFACLDVDIARNEDADDSAADSSASTDEPRCIHPCDLTPPLLNNQGAARQSPSSPDDGTDSSQQPEPSQADFVASLRLDCKNWRSKSRQSDEVVQSTTQTLFAQSSSAKRTAQSMLLHLPLGLLLALTLVLADDATSPHVWTMLAITALPPLWRAVDTVFDKHPIG